MPFHVPGHLIIKETAHWIVNHRVDFRLPGYLMIGARRETTNLFDLEPAALAELGVLLAATQQALRDCFAPDHLYVGRYGHTAGPSVHFHVIPIYAWVKEAFAADARYRVLRTFYSPGVPTSDPDGAELTLYVWREFCENPRPPQVQGLSIPDVVALLRGRIT